MLRPVILPMCVPAAVPVAALPSAPPLENGGNGGNGGGPPPPTGPAIYGNYTQALEGVSQQFGYISLDAGVYAVQIEVLDFATTSFGSHELLITATDASADFTDAQQQGLTGIYGGSSLVFYLGDPASAPNPQTASATLSLQNTAIISLDGRLPMTGDTARIVVTFTLVPP